MNRRNPATNKGPTLWQVMEQWDLFPHHYATTMMTMTTGKTKNNSGKAMMPMMTTTTNKKQKITNHSVHLKLSEKPLRILVTDILHEHKVVQLLYVPRLCQDGSVLHHWIITIHPPLLLPPPLLMHHQKKRYISLSVMWENQCIFCNGNMYKKKCFH